MRFIELIRKYDIPIPDAVSAAYCGKQHTNVYSLMALEVSKEIEDGIRNDIVYLTSKCVFDVFKTTPLEYITNPHKYITSLTNVTDCYSSREGIYFLINNGKCFYIGTSNNVANRVRSHSSNKVFEYATCFFTEHRDTYESILTYLTDSLTIEQFCSTNKGWIKGLSNKWLWNFYANNIHQLPKYNRLDGFKEMLAEYPQEKITK